MENKNMAILVTMAIVLGSLVIQTEAQASPEAQPDPFRKCAEGCYEGYCTTKKYPNPYMCPLICIIKCLPMSIFAPPHHETDHTDYFCKLGCATHHCAQLSSLPNPNVDKVADCVVDSCSDKCSKKNYNQY